MEKKLGKIESIKLGLGGYQDSMIGLTIHLSGDSWDVKDFKGTWDAEIIECSKHCKWTEEDRNKTYSETIRFISKLLEESKVDDLDKLKGMPVEVTFDENKLKEWRVLKEVI